jgi:hypothetical protein
MTYNASLCQATSSANGTTSECLPEGGALQETPLILNGGRYVGDVYPLNADANTITELKVKASATYNGFVLPAQLQPSLREMLVPLGQIEGVRIQVSCSAQQYSEAKGHTNIPAGADAYVQFAVESLDQVQVPPGWERVLTASWSNDQSVPVVQNLGRLALATYGDGKYIIRYAETSATPYLSAQFNSVLGDAVKMESPAYGPLNTFVALYRKGQNFFSCYFISQPDT